MEDHTEHLRMLSICNYVFAVLCAFSACVGTLGFILVLSSMEMVRLEAEAPFLPSVMMLFLFPAGAMLILSMGVSVGAALGGKYIAERRNRQFCIVVAVLECLFVPLGTILGVFTLYLLSKDNVRIQFQDQPG